MKTKLLHLVTAYQSVVTILDSKLKALNNCPGFELHVASSGEDAPYLRKPHGTFHVVPIPRSIRPFPDLVATIRLYCIIRKHRIDLLHTHTAKAGIVGAIAGRLAGIPVIHTYHGLPFFAGQNALSFRVYQWIELFCSRFRTLVFSQNRQDYETLRNLKGLRCPVQFEGNGVDAEYVKRSAQENVDKVSGYFSDSSRVHVLCVARLELVKHLETVIRAVGDLVKRGVLMDCIIAGKGPLKESLESRIAELGLSDSIKIVYTPYIHALISKSDVMVLSSIKEGIPRGLMEGMALGKPVVATDVLGTQELVRNGEMGILVPFGDQAAFSEALARMVGNPGFRDRMGKTGRERILTEFDDRKIVDFWVEKYREILGRRNSKIE